MNLIKKYFQEYFSTFNYFYKFLKFRVFLILFMSIIIGLLDGLGLTMFLPLIQMTDGTSELSSNALGKLSFVLDFFKYLNIPLTLGYILSLLLLFFILKGVMNYINSMYKIVVRQYFIRTLRLRLLNAFNTYAYTSYVKADIGLIQNSFTGEVARVSSAYTSYFGMFQNGIMMLIYIALAFFSDWNFALLITIGALLTNFIFKFFYKKTKSESISLVDNNNEYQGLIIQFMSNFKYLKATGTIENYAKKLEKVIFKLENNSKKIGALDSLISSLREPILIFIVVVVLVIQVYVLEGSIASILISLLFFYRSLTSLMAIQTGYNTFLTSHGSLLNMKSFEKELIQNAESDGVEVLETFNDSIVLNRVSFAYGADHLILNAIDLKVLKNQTIAFIGESGSGKTTLVNILSGLLQHNSGTITIDGIDYKNLNKNSLQKKIGYISQESVVFNDTIFNNITLWDEKTPENLEKFNRVINKASLSEFLSNTTLKEETLLGANGINMSGGQRQRISIARELYKDIEILILDEATSALDSETEKQIQENLEQLTGSFTVIIIAHRLSTIKAADTIYLMEQGTIVDSGNFKSLLGTSSKFKRMVEIQEF